MARVRVRLDRCMEDAQRVDEKAPGAPVVLLLLAVSMPLPARAQPMPGSVAANAAPPAATDFQLLPRNGQDDVQQWFDRYECDSLAKRQSGYDPSHERSGASQQTVSEEYRRAMTACLAQHGYDVRCLPPVSPPPPSPALYAPPGVQQPSRGLRYRPLSMQLGGGYSIAAGSTSDYLHDGANAGAALTWFPSAALPIGVRIEGNYTWLKPASQLLARNGVGYNKGQVDVYGGDVDLQFSLWHLPSRQMLYLVGGVGRYRIDTTLQKVSGVRVCGTHFCGVFATLLAEEHDTSPWERSWNAGVGWEVALDSHTAFFVEARYRRILGDSNGMEFVPIWLGLRF